MNRYNDHERNKIDIAELQNKITELEKENAYLKAILDNAGISYTKINLMSNHHRKYMMKTKAEE